MSVAGKLFIIAVRPFCHSLSQCFAGVLRSSLVTLAWYAFNFARHPVSHSKSSPKSPSSLTHFPPPFMASTLMPRTPDPPNLRSGTAFRHPSVLGRRKKRAWSRNCCITPRKVFAPSSVLAFSTFAARKPVMDVGSKPFSRPHSDIGFFSDRSVSPFLPGGGVPKYHPHENHDAEVVNTQIAVQWHMFSRTRVMKPPTESVVAMNIILR